MANFLITTPNSLAPGTDTTDLFVLNTALGVTVNAAGGADQISAVGTNFVNANFQGGEGADSIYLTAGAGPRTLAITTIAVGAGNDLVAIDNALANNSTTVGGGGNDTIQFSGGTFTDVAINGNLGSDRITASETDFTRALIGGGGDNDSINLNSGDFLSATINGGGGADRLTFVSSTFSAARIEGDVLGDSEFFGNDTIRFDGGSFTGGSINGGEGNDLVQVSAVIGSAVLVEGNQGADSIFLNAFMANGSAFLGGGAGNDTIAVTAALADSFGTIQGGGGLDLINVSGGAVSAGFILGGAEADAIWLGTIASAAERTNAASGVNVAYASFTESNLAGFDTLSATFAGAALSGAGAFMVTQSAVNFRVAAFDRAGVVSGGLTGGCTFAAGFDNSLTARAEALDLALVQGQAVVFQNGAGTNFLFVQGGASGSGAAGDLVVQLNAGFNTNTGGLFAVNNSALKVVIA